MTPEDVMSRYAKQNPRAYRLARFFATTAELLLFVFIVAMLCVGTYAASRAGEFIVSRLFGV
jgi:hypothetical protein